MKFEKVYKLLVSPVTRFVAKRTGIADEKIVDEIVCDTFSSAWKSYSSFKHKSTYFTWLCRIALNKIADYYRDQINHRSRFVVPNLKAFANLEALDNSPIEKMALKELCDNVNKCLDLLPSEKRRLLWYRYWKDYSYAQIAKILHISIRAVEGRLYRAKSSFAEVYTSKL